MNEAYSAFAAGYDRMMGDVDYDGWASYIDEFLREAGAKASSISDHIPEEAGTRRAPIPGRRHWPPT